MRRALRLIAVGALLLGLAAWLAVTTYGKQKREIGEETLGRVEAACENKKEDPRCLQRFSSLCDEGVPRACRRAAQAYGCGRGTEPSRQEAERGYVKACGLGDGPSCDHLALEYVARVDQESGVPVPYPEEDAVKLRVVYIKSRYADGKADALRGAWGWAKAVTPELLFLDAAAAVDHGRAPEADALLRTLRAREGDDPAVRTLEAYRDELGKGARPGVEALLRAWKRSGSPDLRGDRFLPLSPIQHEPWDCSLIAWQAPPPGDPGADDGAFLRAVAGWGTTPPSERLLQAAADRAVSADPYLAWIAASFLERTDVPEASRARTQALLSEVVPRLARELPGVPELVIWQRVRERRFFAATPIASNAWRALAREKVYRLYLDAHRAADPMDAVGKAWGGTLLVFENAPVGEYVEGVVDAASGQSLERRKRSAKHLAGLAESLAQSGSWWHVSMAPWILWKAQKLSEDASYESLWQEQQERAARIETSDGRFPRLGRWPLRAVALEFLEESALDETGFYERLYEAGAR
ncbi:MAG TPA: hypothetical protein VFA20_09630 [Myxococcaceae bacterium]|nr:hypothetical protein [Myxococcaceae bacterium]